MSAIDIINGKFFADAAKSTPSKSLYKRGVQVRYMSGKNPIKFRLLPAFNPEDDNPETSIAPWVYADGTPSDWIATIQAAQFVGGDRGYNTILCLETLGQSCPYQKVYRFASKSNDWKYLTERTATKSAVLPPVRRLMLMNILDLEQQDKGCQLGVFTQNAAQTLYSKENGIMWQINPQFMEEVNELNYMNQYAYGDLTCPTYGLALRCSRGPQARDGYRITIDLDSNRRAYRWPISEEVLAGRSDLANIESFLEPTTAQDTVDKLIDTLNQRSPNGYSELALLQEVLGDEFRIPQPPSAPAATSTVQGWDGQNDDVEEDTGPDPIEYTPPTPPAPVKKQATKTVRRPQSVTTAADLSAKNAAHVQGVPGEPISEDLLAQLRRRA